MRPSRKSGQTIDVARIVSVGQDRKTGDGVVRLRDDDGQTVALRLRPQQFRTLSRGLFGLLQSRALDPSEAPGLAREDWDLLSEALGALKRGSR